MRRAGVNPRDLANAYVKVAEANHYLVQVMQICSFAELDAAEQILISRDNATENEDPVLNRALDILEHDRKAAKAELYLTMRPSKP